MSRSRRKTPIIGMTTAESEKDDKKRWHRAWRRAAKQSVDAGEFDSYRQHSDRWSMSKDGRQYLRDPETRKKWLRK